jgi:hypothetical protein
MQQNGERKSKKQGSRVGDWPHRFKRRNGGAPAKAKLDAKKKSERGPSASLGMTARKTGAEANSKEPTRCRRYEGQQNNGGKQIPRPAVLRRDDNIRNKATKEPARCRRYEMQEDGERKSRAVAERQSWMRRRERERSLGFARDDRRE